MTARELIAELQKLSDEDKDKQVECEYFTSEEGSDVMGEVRIDEVQVEAKRVVLA